MIAWPSLKFRQPLGMCAPAVINTNPLYPVGYIALTLLAPLGVITGVNMKMTRIARYHRVSYWKTFPRISTILILIILSIG